MLPSAPRSNAPLYEQAAARPLAPSPEQWSAYHIAVVIPAYNEAHHIGQVLADLPSFLRTIIVVDDCSRDDTAAIVENLAKADSRIVLVRHDKNQGVGGAMISGFRCALQQNAQIVVKLDGDGQMAASDLSALLRPLVAGTADYAKGNRFRDFHALSQMPVLRRAGNMGLSFLTKAAVGYWNCFDPCNGFIAIRSEVLAAVPLVKIHKSYFFETSMLAQLYLLGAVLCDVPMPARYGNEVSHLSITRVLLEFPPKLGWALARRLILKNFLYDFSMCSLYLVSGLLLSTMGVLYGGINWVYYASIGQGAPTGTVVIPSMLIVVGIQILLAAIAEDLRSTPTVPLCVPLSPAPQAGLSTIPASLVEGETQVPASERSAQAPSAAIRSSTTRPVV